MRKIREVLRLRLGADLSIRQISASTKTSVGAIQKLLSRFDALSLGWPLPETLDDNHQAALLYPGADTATATRYQVHDWTQVHQDLKRKGMTKQLLREEYTAHYPNHCYSYSQYCERYRQWQKKQKQKRSMRQSHKAGEKCLVDYCGPTLPIIYPQTGEVRQAQVFVAVLGASNYTYAEATWSQGLRGTGSPAMCVLSSTSAGCRRWSCRIICAAASAAPAATTPNSTPVTSNWRAIIKWPSCRWVGYGLLSR